MYATKNHKHQYDDLDRMASIFLGSAYRLKTLEPHSETLARYAQQIAKDFNHALNDTALTEMSKLGHTKYFIARYRDGVSSEPFREHSIVVEFNINDWHQYETVRITHIKAQEGKPVIDQHIFDTSDYTITRKVLLRKPNGYGALLDAVDGRHVSV